MERVEPERAAITQVSQYVKSPRNTNLFFDADGKRKTGWIISACRKGKKLSVFVDMD